MTNFPSLYVRREPQGTFRFVISSWAGEQWRESLVSSLSYDNWMDAHIEGAEALANLVMPRDHEDYEDGINSELPVYRVVGRAG